jgi:hypothetical protein
MKKACIILIMALLQQIAILAQDLVVTTDGDSLNCKITNIKDDFIYFTFKNQNEVRNTLLPVAQVTSYVKNFYEISEVQPEQIVSYQPDFQHWRFAGNIGWGNRTAPLADGLDPIVREYAKKLSSGLYINLEANYYFKEFIGAGLKYGLFKTSNSIYIVEDNISINFIGPSFSMRLLNKSKTCCLLFNYSIGYMGYTDKGQVEGTPIEIKGSTVGFDMSAGFDFALTKHLSAGIQLSLISGMLTEIDETINGYTEKKTLEKGSYEGLGQFNITVGLRYNL